MSRTDRELFYDALALVIRTERASISMIQRQLRIGLPDAIEVFFKLADVGVIDDIPGLGLKVMVTSADGIEYPEEYGDE